MFYNLQGFKALYSSSHIILILPEIGCIKVYRLIYTSVFAVVKKAESGSHWRTPIKSQSQG
ncbi:hypothetical protein ALT1545_350015 [Alteromonas macleodii]